MQIKGWGINEPRKRSWTLSRKAFNKFLTSLNALNLNVRDKVNPEYLEASEEAAKLIITLYDDNNLVYAKYWIGGWNNQFGNIIGETLSINEKVKKIIPHLEDFSNSGTNKESYKKVEKEVKPEKDTRILQINSDTSKVRIEYWPYSLFPPKYNGAFITTVTPYEVNPNVTQESTREMIPMTQSRYQNFLNALQTLKLEIREEAVEQFEPGSYSPAKLKIQLYDKNGVVYNDLWLDGRNGGNIVGNVDIIEKQITFYEVPNLIKEKEIKMKSSRLETTKPICKKLSPGVDDISYRWWAILVLISEVVFAWFMLTQSQNGEMDSDGRILAGLYFFVSLCCTYYLFHFKKTIAAGTWWAIAVVSTIACLANSLLLPMWNYSLTGAYFLLSLGLSLISSFTLLIKKNNLSNSVFTI